MQKRLLAVIPLCLCMLLGGCAKSPETVLKESRALERLAGQFEATVEITGEGLSAAASVLQDSPQACTVQFSAPDSLKDMTFTFRQDNVDVSYRGLAFSFDPSALPASSAAKAVITPLKAAVQAAGTQVSLKDGELELSGVSESGRFLLTLDAGDGIPTKLSLPDGELRIDFTSFTYSG